MNPRFAWCLFLGAFLAAGHAWADALVDEAKAMLAQNRPGDAYRLLEKREAEKAGNPEFDFLLGEAALAAGQPTRAIFAYERVLVLDPGNARARAGIAKAYLAVGESEAARGELQIAKNDKSLSPELAGTIDRLLDAANRAADGRSSLIKGYVELFGGRDTNVNAGPDRSAVAIPGICCGPLFPLTAAGRQQSDNFIGLAGGLDLRHSLMPGLALVAGVNANRRWNNDWSTFDTGGLDVHVGAVWNRQQHTVSVNLQQSEFYLDGDRFRTARGFGGMWQYTVNARNQFSLFAQYADLEYHSQRSRDADRLVAGGVWAHAYNSDKVVYVSLYGVNEQTRHGGLDYLGHKAWGSRVGGHWTVDSKLSVFGNVSYERRRFGDVDPFYLARRHDSQYGLSLGANYLLSKDWALIPQFALTRNRSNVDLSDYQREVYSLALKYVF